MNRGVWVDANNDLDPAKVQKHGLSEAFFDGRWLAAKTDPLAYLAGVKQLVRSPGIFLCAQGEGWPSPATMTGAEWAWWAYDLVQHKIAPGTGGAFPLVDLNAEVDDLTGWVIPMLRQWRRHSPRRATALVVCAHKAELFRPVVNDLINLNVIVKPECFVDPGMQRVESSYEVLAWEGIGFPAERIVPCLAGDQLGAWWGGTAFTMGRLPS